MRYLTAMRKLTSTVLLNLGNIDRITVYVSKENIVKEMAARIV
jgi:hypothetical protein